MNVNIIIQSLHITFYFEEKCLHNNTIIKGFKYFESLDTLGCAISEILDSH